MFLLVLAHPGCPRQSPQSRKMVVVVIVNVNYCCLLLQIQLRYWLYCCLAVLQCVRPMVGLTALVHKAHIYEILLKLMTSVDVYV